MQASTRNWNPYDTGCTAAHLNMIWTVHLKVPGGNHRALVLQKNMTKSIPNSSFLLVNPAKMLPTYADVPEPTACSKLSQTGFHYWTGSCYYIMLYRLYPPLENKECPWTYPKLKASEVVVSGGPIPYTYIYIYAACGYIRTSPVIKNQRSAGDDSSIFFLTFCW